MRPAIFLSAILSVVSIGAYSTVMAGGLDADFYVSPQGDDENEGSLASPFASLDRARLAVRERIAAGMDADVTVLIRGGQYRIAAPIVFGIADSPPIGRTVEYAAFPGERPVISGGRLINGWSLEPDGTWKTFIPDVAAGSWRFRELFVNGRRRQRAQHPNSGFLRVDSPDPAGGPNNRFSFRIALNDLPASSNYGGAELVFLHDWTISRVLIDHVDHATRVLRTSDPIGATGLVNSIFQYEGHPRYAIENDPALLDAPGEWHLNEQSGILRYRPMPGDFIETAEVIAPVAKALLVVRGDMASGAAVRNLRFRGITFEHCAWDLRPGGYASYQSGDYEWRDFPSPYELPTAVTFEVAENCTFEAGKIAHCGGWGIMLGARCRNCRLAGNIITDIAGQGFLLGEDRFRQINHAQWWTTHGTQAATNNVAESNLVEHCGTIFHDCIPAWVGLTHKSTIANNVLRHAPWSGLSIGNLWNDMQSPARENVIRANRIHDVMTLLSDGAGIYVVGKQPDSLITGNRIYAIPENVGVSESNGLFFDQGATGFHISKNGIYDVHKSPLRFHMAGANVVSENTVRLHASGMQWIRYQSTSQSLITLQDNLVIDPIAPPPCDDPVCDQAAEAGIAPAYFDIVYADDDGDGLPNVDDPTPSHRPGDIDGNALLDARDLLLMMKILLAEPVSSVEYHAADSNGDGVVEYADVPAFVEQLLN